MYKVDFRQLVDEERAVTEARDQYVTQSVIRGRRQSHAWPTVTDLVT